MKELSFNKTAQLTDADEKPRIYRIGDTIEFSIDVTNTGDVSLEHIKVTDMLEGAVLEAGEGYTICEDGTAMIANLAAGERVTVKATCEVTEDQIGRTDFVNRVKAEAGALEASRSYRSPIRRCLWRTWAMLRAATNTNAVHCTSSCC